MSHYSLARYIGTGRPGDPFRPRGHDQPFWRGIDLRPDCTRPEGYALLVSPERVRERGVIDLGPSPDDRWSLRALASRLGVSLDRGSLRHAAADLLIGHSRTDGTRWRPLWPEHDGMYRIWLGGLLWAMPTLRGGASFPETWPTSHVEDLNGDQPWTLLTPSAAWGVTNQRAVFASSAGSFVARCDTPLATADHGVTVTVVGYTHAASLLIANVLCRKANDTVLTYYDFSARQDTTGPVNEHRLGKVVAGTTTQLGSSDPADAADGETLRVEASGTSITGTLTGGISVGPITDSAIDGVTVGGFHIGMRGFSNGGGNNFTMDNLFAEDLAIPGPRWLMTAGRPRPGPM